MTVLSAQKIKYYTQKLKLIESFVDAKTYTHNGIPTVSYGLSNAGYDIRLNRKDLRILRPDVDILDIKNVKGSDFQNVIVLNDGNGEYVNMPPWSFILGVAVEKLNMPDFLVARCYGKSSYARVGIIPHVTPVEPGWSGYLTLEISNLTHKTNKLYINEGIVQLVFEYLNETTESPYGSGRYQDQDEEVTLARITNPMLKNKK